jgi:uncharacterized protein with von Willebrand factor type A (vWA) domain
MFEQVLLLLFHEIRKEKTWSSPGPADFMLLLQLIQSEKYKIKNFQDLVFVMETLFLKSAEHRPHFVALLKKNMQFFPDFYQFLLDNRVETQQVNTKISHDQSRQEKAEKENIEEQKQSHASTVTTKTESAASPSQSNAPIFDEALQQHNISFSLSQSGKTSIEYKAVRQEAETETSVIESPFKFGNDYLPVKNRHLQQAWKNLRLRQKGLESNEPDILQTIKHTAKKGFFSTIQFHRKQINRLKLIILIDQSESMIAVEEFGEELRASAADTLLEENVETRYFYRLPQYNEQMDSYTFTDKAHTKTSSLKKLFAGSQKQHIAVLIYSDAGCLKEEYSKQRINGIKAFLEALGQKVGFTAWINPAPKNRWRGTNAEEIATVISSFDTTRTDIEASFSALKGKTNLKKN